MTVPEVAELLRLHRITVYKMIQRGDLPGIKVAKAVRVDPGDLDKAMHPPGGTLARV